MSNLPLVTDATATRDQATALSTVRQALGSVPNLTRAMANSPALLHGYLQFAGSLDAGTLPRPTRERLAIAIAQSNTCSYCLSAHSYADNSTTPSLPPYAAPASATPRSPR